MPREVLPLKARKGVAGAAGTVLVGVAGDGGTDAVGAGGVGVAGEGGMLLSVGVGVAEVSCMVVCC